MTGVKTFPFFDIFNRGSHRGTSQRGTWAESIQNMNNRGNE